VELLADYGRAANLIVMGRGEAAGAVRAALPFIREAHQVTLFVVPENDRFDKSVSRLAKMLRWHNPNVTIQPPLEHSRSPVAVLLDAAVQAGCGLLVMGGYGHSRLQETVFGGFTRTVLKAAPLPVLLAH
jgi:nucleotide-binding universal stress UspA family protein